MFEDSGRKVRVLSLIVFILLAVAGFIGGIALFINAGKLGSRGGIFVLFGFVSLIGGPLAGYISGLLLNAFGTLVENSDIAVYELSQKVKKSSVGTQNLYSTSNVNNGVLPNNNPYPIKTKVVEKQNPKEIKINLLNSLYAQGKITKEEYDEEIRKIGY